MPTVLTDTMAKKRKKTKRYQRDTIAITNLNQMLYPKFTEKPVRKHKKLIISDRREWKPEKQTKDLTRSGLPVEYKITTISPKSKIKDETRGSISYKRSKYVMVCKRRKDRRETLFRLQKAGKGIKSPKLRKYTENSKIVCEKRRK